VLKILRCSKSLQCLKSLQYSKSLHMLFAKLELHSCVYVCM
jgi:hypothetical protein